jgi:hypothetical protein
MVLQLLTTAAAYGGARHLSESRVSKLVFGDGQKLTSLSNGADLNTRRFEAAMQWFSDHWPEGAAWPEAVPRPIPSASHPVDAAPAAAPPTQPGAAAGSPVHREAVP